MHQGSDMDVAVKQVNIQLLGPVAVRAGDRLVTPTAAKQRKILALLALNLGRVVTVQMLKDELWGDDPPATSHTTLQTYILQLRKRLTSAAANHSDSRLICTHHGGYLLQEAPCRIDIAEFDSLARRGRAAAESGDHHTASELLSRALEIWRGPAFADVPAGRILEIEAISLEEKRLGIIERRIEADLALNRHSDLLGELRLLTAKHPMNENLAGFLIIALYRSGHAGRALEEFQRLRACLRGELGIEPSRRLEQLQQAILARDPALETEDQFTSWNRRGTSRAGSAPIDRPTWAPANHRDLPSGFRLELAGPRR
jgi:DNA-binding SARP family transcriptional activator